MPTLPASCNHSTLQGDLVCFMLHAHLIDAVSRCSGHGKSGDDYCTFCPSDKYFSHKGNRKSNLGLYEEYFDNDADCASGFDCIKRPRFTSLPGCEGTGVRGKDYCIPL